MTPAAPPRRILIVSPGTLGDLDPFLAISRHLVRDGHHVTIATLHRHAETVRASGAAFAAAELPRFADAEDNMADQIFRTPERAEDLFRTQLLDVLPELIAQQRPLVESHDVCITQSYSTAAQMVAEAGGRPWLSAAMSPFSLASRLQPPFEPRRPGTVERTQRESIAHFDRLLAPFHAARASLGLPRRAFPRAHISPQGMLILFSRHFARDPGDWPQPHAVVGFCRHVAAPDPAEWERARRFLAAGPPPVLFTQGSHSDAVAARFFRDGVEAAGALGQRAVVVGRTAAEIGIEETGRVACFARLPYARVFPHARAIVAHSGMGTMARALEAGRPILAVPSPVTDQPDNARSAARLGVAEVLPLPAFDRERATAALGRLLHEPRYAEAAQRMAHALAEEGNGAARAAYIMVQVSLGRRLRPKPPADPTAGP